MPSQPLLKVFSLKITDLYLKNQRLIGWCLLAISFAAGIVTIYMGAFVDEADNLVVGSLMVQRYALYRDVFSHHFPFPYYWMAMVIGLFGESILIARLSVLAFQTTVFALGMRLSGDEVTAGVLALLWSVFRSFYRGNMVLYQNFSGPALLLIFILLIAIFQQRTTPGWKHWIAIGLACAIAIGSDPLSVYPVAMALVFLLFKKPIWGLKTGLVIGGIFSLYAGYLLITDNIQAFWDNAVLFNSQIYNKYKYANPIRTRELYHFIVSGLEIGDKVWLNFDPFRKLLLDYAYLDTWFYTGFLYRFAIIAASLFLALRKQFRAAAFTYLFAASLLIIGKWDFHGQPFILVSLFVVSVLITQEWWHGAERKWLRIVQVVVGVIALVFIGGVSLRLVNAVYQSRDAYREASQFTNYRLTAADVKEFTCNQPDVYLAHYPGGTYIHWFTGMKPVSRYVYMWPWVAEVATDEVIEALDQEQVLAIVMLHDETIWDLYQMPVYLQPVYAYVGQNYYNVSAGVYISPALYEICSK